jgi:holo-[acyl-carrier protein] synthase
MRIIGHGIDVIETQRLARLLEEHGERFLARCYTEQERNYAQNRRRQIEHLAGRFAAKEAIFKALGTGWSGGIAWTDAEVLRLNTGQPTVALHGVCKQVAQEMGITRWWLSISHTEALATASVIAEGAD